MPSIGHSCGPKQREFSVYKPLAEFMVNLSALVAQLVRATGRQPGGSGFESQSGGCFRVSLSDRIRRLDADSTSLTIGEAIRAFQTASLSNSGRLSDRIEVDWARGAGKSIRLRRVNCYYADFN